jgi:small basic protein (TIGR04137 family)
VIYACCAGKNRVDKPRRIHNLSALYPGENIMSMHSSFKSASKIAVRRNVLKRHERVNQLTKEGRWKSGDRALGLPKTKPAE